MKCRGLFLLFGFLLVFFVSASLVYGFNGERDPVAVRTETRTSSLNSCQDCGLECDPENLQKRVMEHKARSLMEGEFGAYQRVQERRFGSR